MHACPGNWLAIGRAVGYNARTAHAFGAGIECRHCTHFKQWCIGFPRSGRVSILINIGGMGISGGIK